MRCFYTDIKNISVSGVSLWFLIWIIVVQLLSARVQFPLSSEWPNRVSSCWSHQELIFGCKTNMLSWNIWLIQSQHFVAWLIRSLKGLSRSSVCYSGGIVDFLLQRNQIQTWFLRDKLKQCWVRYYHSDSNTESRTSIKHGGCFLFTLWWSSFEAR